MISAYLSHHHQRDLWIQIGFVLSQIGLAFWQAGRFAAQVAISHSFWGCAVAAEILILSLLARRRVKTGVLMTLERFVFFGPSMNRIRGKPFFYTNASGSWMDKFLPRWAYISLWFISIFIIAFWQKHKKNEKILFRSR